MGLGFPGAPQSRYMGSNHLARIQDKLLGSQFRMATGSRVQRPGDDASGLGIATKMQSLIDSFQVAGRNVTDGISLAQTAESGLGQVSDALSRMRELAVQAGNGTLSSSDRAALDTEYQELKDEVDRISDTTEFNGVNLLDGSASSVDLQSGAYEGQTTSVDLTDSSTAALGVDGSDLSSASSASSALSAIDDAIDSVSSSRASFGTSVNTLSSGLATIQTARGNLSDARSRLADLDYARETAEFTKLSLLQSAGIATQVQGNLSAGRVMSMLLGRI